MFYNCRDIFVCLLSLPVLLNIVLPLAILAVWLLQRLFVRKSLQNT